MPAMTSESTPLRLRRLIQNQFHTPVGGASLLGIVAGQRPGIGIADGPQARTVDAVGLKIADHTAGASTGELPVGGIATAAHRHRIGVAFHGNGIAAVLEDGNQAAHDSQTGKRSEEHTSELQSLMRISYGVFCFKKKNE